MPGSHAEDIVGDYFESDDWAEQLADDGEAFCWIMRRFLP